MDFDVRGEQGMDFFPLEEALFWFMNSYFDQRRQFKMP